VTVVHQPEDSTTYNIYNCITTTVRLNSTQEKFPRTENVPKISLIKVENFQLQNFFPKICVGQSHFTQTHPRYSKYCSY
jgi:hypothetical protein